MIDEQIELWVDWIGQDNINGGLLCRHGIVVPVNVKCRRYMPNRSESYSRVTIQRKDEGETLGRCRKVKNLNEIGNKKK